MKVSVFVSLIGQIDAHGSMYEPPPRGGHGLNILRPICPGGSCLWFNQGTSIGCPFATGGGSVVPDEPDCANPATPTLKFKDKDLRTYALKADSLAYGDWTQHHPWRYPGSAPVRDPCGIAGGWFTEGTPGNGGFAPIGVPQGDLGSTSTRVPKLLEETVWIADSVAEVGWGITANHGGGYQYRLCPADSELTEDCFQKTPLQFVGSTQWIQHGYGMNRSDRVEIPAVTVPGDRVIPSGSTWRRNPIPACSTPISGGAIHSPCLGPIFTPPFKPHKEGVSYGFGAGTCESLKDGACSDKEFAKHFFDFGIVDQVKVPDVPEGKYVLSFRWDVEQTPQVWNQCADITIKKSGPASKPFVETTGCTACCSEGAICANCSQCVNKKDGDCAYCWQPLPGYAPGIPPMKCLGHDDPVTGGETRWLPGDDSKSAILSFGCTKCWSDDKYCAAHEREAEADPLTKEELTVTAGKLSISWQDCGDAETHSTLTELNPDTIQIGKLSTLMGKGVLDKNVSATHFDFVAALSGVPFVGVDLVHAQGDLCKENKINLNFMKGGASFVKLGYITLGGFNCPIEAGDVNLEVDVHISELVPASLAHTNIALTIVDPTNNDKLLCTTIQTFKKKDSSVMV